MHLFECFDGLLMDGGPVIALWMARKKGHQAAFGSEDGPESLAEHFVFKRRGGRTFHPTFKAEICKRTHPPTPPVCASFAGGCGPFKPSSGDISCRISQTANRISYGNGQVI